MNVKNQNVH